MDSPADRLLAAAPFLVAAAGALLLWRAVPALLDGVLHLARRSRRAGALLAVARARSAGAVLPFVALVVVVTLTALGGALVGTSRAGQSAGSWDNVGADALVRSTLPDPSLPAVAEQLAGTDGVAAVAVGRVAARSRLFGVPGVDAVRVLAVDPAAYGALLARTPFGTAPELTGLTRPSTAAGALPALVPGALLGTAPSLRWGDVTIDLEPVGEVPDTADGAARRHTCGIHRAGRPRCADRGGRGRCHRTRGAHRLAARARPGRRRRGEHPLGRRPARSDRRARRRGAVGCTRCSTAPSGSRTAGPTR